MSATPFSPDGVTTYAPRRGKTYSTVSSNIDLATDFGCQANMVQAASAGTLACTTVGGDAITLYLAAGVPVYCCIAQLTASGTSATGITVFA